MYLLLLFFTVPCDAQYDMEEHGFPPFSPLDAILDYIMTAIKGFDSTDEHRCLRIMLPFPMAQELIASDPALVDAIRDELQKRAFHAVLYMNPSMPYIDVCP